MKNILFDINTGDFVLTNNNLTFTSNIPEFVQQKLKQKLKLFLGEWWLNPELGIDYYGKILKKNPDLNLVRTIFTREIQNTMYVKEIIKLDTVFDTTQRKYNIDFEVKLTTGEIIEVNL